MARVHSVDPAQRCRICPLNWNSCFHWDIHAYQLEQIADTRKALKALIPASSVSLSTEWSEAKQHRKDAQKSVAEIGLAYVEAGLEDSRQESKKQGLKTLVDKLRWKIKYEDLAQGVKGVDLESC
jgi:hypothetical protein